MESISSDLLNKDIVIIFSEDEKLVCRGVLNGILPDNTCIINTDIGVQKVHILDIKKIYEDE